MRHLSPENLQELEAALVAESTDLEAEIADHARNVNADWQGATTPDDAGNDDAADRIEELATNVSLVETLENRLREMQAALKRIKEGTYGTCIETGEPIPLARLRANPAAERSITVSS